MMELEKALILYILKRQNDIHPFRISRILLLFEIEYSNKFGEKPTNFVYRLQPYTFYIEGFTNFIESIPEIEKIREVDDKGIPVRGYLHLKNPEIQVDLPKEMTEILDNILKMTSDWDDQKLNQYVVATEDYQKLYEEFGD